MFLRLFEELEDLPVYLLTDISRSMYVEEPPRAIGGLRAALALTSIALNQHDSVGLFPFSDELEVAIRPRSGKRSFMRFARAMVEFEPGGETNLGRSLRKLNALRLREGLCVIVSDFFDPSGAKGITAALATVRHKLLLVQLVRASDRKPGLSGDLQLRDCESGAVEDVSATPRVMARYQEAYDRFQAEIVGFARARNVGLLQLDVEQDVLPQLATLFSTGSYTV